MANSINYANIFEKTILEDVLQGSLTSMFMTNKVNFLNGHSFTFQSIALSGLKNHNRTTSAWNRGSVTETEHVFSLEMDRNTSYLLDILDQDESMGTANIETVMKEFQRNILIPEMDSYFFSKVATTAKGLAGYHSETATSAYTTANVLTKLRTFLNSGKLRRYTAQGAGAIIIYVNSTIMDLLQDSDRFTRTINMEALSDSGMGIETRITSYNGCVICEVIDDSRFYDKFDFGTELGGAQLVAHSDTVVGSKKINVLIASPVKVKTVQKLNNVYVFPRGSHTEGDGDLFQVRTHYGTIIQPNGNQGIDCLYCDTDSVEYVAV